MQAPGFRRTQKQKLNWNIRCSSVKLSGQFAIVQSQVTQWDETGEWCHKAFTLSQNLHLLSLRKAAVEHSRKGATFLDLAGSWSCISEKQSETKTLVTREKEVYGVWQQWNEIKFRLHHLSNKAVHRGHKDLEVVGRTCFPSVSSFLFWAGFVFT